MVLFECTDGQSINVSSLKRKLSLCRIICLTDCLTDLFDCLVKLNGNARRKDSLPSPFKPTGACSRSSGCTRRRFVPASSSHECSAATSPACACSASSRTVIATARWPTTPRWQPLLKNCKYQRPGFKISKFVISWPLPFPRITTLKERDPNWTCL